MRSIFNRNLILSNEALLVLGVLALSVLLSSAPATAQDTAYGSGALASPSSGDLYDSAFGYNALHNPTNGTEDTAIGAAALIINSEGSENTATGVGAMESNTTGNNNTATGYYALQHNTSADYNTAIGTNALQYNLAYDNTAAGAYALNANSLGSDNTAIGTGALYHNLNASGNTAVGYAALDSNDFAKPTGDPTTATQNTASGNFALYSNTTGAFNVADGAKALIGATTGSNNIGLGASAGSNILTGSNNIEIGGAGTADESATIRIGTKGSQSATYIAGISGVPVVGADVAINSAGRLGVVMSSRHYKREIRGMGNASAALMRLRPVTFRYKSDPAGILQYGLVAEEVKTVYPELVTYGADGKVESVRYLELTAMLLNELQKQAKEVRETNRENKHQAEQLQKLAARCEQQDVRNQRLFAQVSQLRSIVEQIPATYQTGTRTREQSGPMRF